MDIAAFIAVAVARFVVPPFIPRFPLPAIVLALFDHPLIEKTLLVGLIITIFLQLFPDTDRSVLSVTFGVGVVVAASAYVSYWLSVRGRSWTGTGVSFVGTGAINLGIVLVLGLLPGRNDADGTSLPLTVLMIGLLTLIVVLYDRYRDLRLQSVGVPGSGAIWAELKVSP